MSQVKTVALVYGGKSAEHPISCISARTVLEALLEHFKVLLVAIDPAGNFNLCADEDKIRQMLASDPRSLPMPQANACLLSGQNGQPALVGADGSRYRFDVLFPITHGPNGEDGRLQGLCEMLDIPQTGCGMYASALCMDKAVFKDFLSCHNVEQTPYTWFFFSDYKNGRADEQLQKVYSWPRAYVKPSRMGSSIGISRVDDPADRRDDLEKAIELAGQHDDKIVIEKAVEMVELEFAVIGEGDAIELAGPGMIRASEQFYSFEAKYESDDAAELSTDTGLTTEQIDYCRNSARQAYRLSGCSGFARVDGFYTPEGRYLINEINTLPGFTSISMFPRLWQDAGLKPDQLVKRLLEAAARS